MPVISPMTPGDRAGSPTKRKPPKTPSWLSPKVRTPQVPNAPAPSGQQAPRPMAPAPAQESYGGGGGYSGGGGYATYSAPPPPMPPRMNLTDYIAKDPTYTAEISEGKRRLADFDAESLLGRQRTEAEQAVKLQDLGRFLTESSLGNAESMAGRGLLRSGGTFLNQDKINAEGNVKRNSIQDLLTQFLQERARGRTAQEAANRQAANERISQITQQYNSNPMLGY